MVQRQVQRFGSYSQVCALIKSLKPFGPEVSHTYKKEIYLNFFPYHSLAMNSM